MNGRVRVALLASMALASAASPAFGGVVNFQWDISTNSQGNLVIDSYATFIDNSYVVESVFNTDTFLLVGNFVHSDLAGGTWAPQLVGDAENDSFVTIGGMPGFANTASGANWGLDGFFQQGIPDGASWFNQSPANMQGAAIGGKVFLGRFVLTPGGCAGITATVTFNQGIGTPSMSFTGLLVNCIPAPATVTLAIVPFGARPRRRTT